ncbi:MAG: hypothetical protein GX556_15960 [Fibrobacter sp.]|nr:hypothetical protein [Fibrobacter sp.]
MPENKPDQEQQEPEPEEENSSQSNSGTCIAIGVSPVMRSQQTNERKQALKPGNGSGVLRHVSG